MHSKVFANRVSRSPFCRDAAPKHQEVVAAAIVARASGDAVQSAHRSFCTAGRKAVSIDQKVCHDSALEAV
eukprot:XP_001710291.1 Hypothetical protein GL50803_101249 [Giardia lamblia ATCC 50803]